MTWEDVTFDQMQQAARAMLDALEVAERVSMDQDDLRRHYYRLRDGSPAWMQGVVREAHDHGEMLPDDERYTMILCVVRALASEDVTDEDEARDYVTDDLPVYTGAMIHWLDTYAGRRLGYCDEAVDEFGPDAFKARARDGGSFTFALLQGGYAFEQEEVFAQVLDALQAHIADTADTDEDA